MKDTRTDEPESRLIFQVSYDMPKPISGFVLILDSYFEGDAKCTPGLIGPSMWLALSWQCQVIDAFKLLAMLLEVGWVAPQRQRVASANRCFSNNNGMLSHSDRASLTMDT